jgi:hypothetical protein
MMWSSMGVRDAGALGTEINLQCSPNPGFDHRKQYCRGYPPLRRLVPSRRQLKVSMSNFGAVD